MFEVETKVLNINVVQINHKLAALGAERILDSKLSVDWYGPKGLTHDGDDPWFLRTRSHTDGKIEVTWKGISHNVGQSRQTKEVNFIVSNAEEVKELFEALNLEHYAHQEKWRTSWTFKDWRFDIDQYPGMLAFMEIEGQKEGHVTAAIKLLGLEDHKTFNKGERMLIQNEYKINWFNIKFT